MVEEILKEFEEKFPIEESSDFSTCKVRREFTFTGNIAFWLKEKLTSLEKKTKEDEQNRIWAYVEEYCEEHLSDDAGFYHYPTVIKDLSNIIFDK